MSERFGDLLSGVVDSASGAAREPGAAAARERGRKRRNQQRLAASALSLALLGAVGGIAAVSMHGSNGVPAAHATGTSAPASPSASPSGTPSSAPSSATGSPSSPTSSTSAIGSSPAGSTPGVSASPSRFVSGAWLDAQQMPMSLTGYTDWQPVTDAAGTHISGDVFQEPTSQAATWCTDFGMGGLPSLTTGLTGDQLEQFDGSNSDQIRANGVIPAHTWQSALFYRNTADATTALNDLASSFATCKTQVTALDPTTGIHNVGSTQQTLSQSNAQCWSVLAIGSAANATGTLDHDCFVQNGNMIEEVNIEANQVRTLNTINFTTTDNTLIPELQHDLSQYSAS